MESEWIGKYEVVNSGKYDKIAKTYKGFKPWVEQGYISTKEAPGKTMISTYFKKKDLDELLQLIYLLETQYITDKEAVKLLGFEGKSPLHGTSKRKEILKGIIGLCNSERIEFKYFEKGFKKIYLFVNKEQLLHFLNTNIRCVDAWDKYKVSYEDIYALEKKYDIKRITITKNNYFYRLLDAEKYFKPLIRNVSEFYSLDEVMSILGFSRNILNALREEGNLEPSYIKGKIFYLKLDIEKVRREITEIQKGYCTAQDVMDICNLKSFQYDKFTNFKTNVLARSALGSKAQIMFSLEEVYEYKKEIELRNEISRVLNSKVNTVNRFYEILKLKQIAFSGKCPHTEQEWYLYCEQKLSLSNGSNQVIKTTISQYVDCTNYLSNLTLENELYSLTSNNINLELFNNSISSSKQCKLYSFLLEYHAKLNTFVKDKKEIKKSFNMLKVINPYFYESVEKPKETYDYSEYIEIYDYAKLMTHKHKAIIDAEQMIDGTGEHNYYACAWLYVLTHLGNAWRHGDVMSLPMINLKELGSITLEELKGRDLTKDEANSIVNQIKRRDLTVNKTGALNRFNCPDDLILPFATAAVICALIVTRRTSIIRDEHENLVNRNLIDFGLQDNEIISRKAHNMFFEGIKRGEFRFKSLKMNRTVLVIMYMVLVRKGRGSAALEMAQKLRAHEDFESTNIYLVIPEEELDDLCQSLFSRKHFGYIPDLLASILFDDNNNRDERTQEIIAISNTLGGIYGIQATSGFINRILSERKLVAEEILRMGIDEVSNLMFDLETNTLPSQNEHFQCIVSPNCRKPELDSCKDCPFAVPNFYAISSLVEGVRESIFNFVREFETHSFEGEKTRLMNCLYKDMDNLERAMQRFGQAEVFNFFENGVEEYNQLLNLLDELQSKTGEEFEKYLTFNPIYLE
ncbi:hypothetical protein [Halalkalibacter alkaliphilus]|uniref:Uncharacterized protein n=1 Tax=Halalkalibacter alkaliphilus TaxID=2917993 RepID=A0A9X2CRV4_9BACI|nr:hypothetical protein [Halalkalibacter alkaliphilus]MCL7747048.1 hypothetical protein [Halalkalibacter alkaliphilus]